MTHPPADKFKLTKIAITCSIICSYWSQLFPPKVDNGTSTDPAPAASSDLSKRSTNLS